MKFISDDNFLDKEEIIGLHETMLSKEVPWNLMSNGLIFEDGSEKAAERFKINTRVSYGSQMVHQVYGGGEGGPLWPMVSHVFSSFCNNNDIVPTEVVRAKANLTWRDHIDDRYAPHIDGFDDHNVFLYYVNDSDGDTILFDKSYDPNAIDLMDIEPAARITPKAGRGVAWWGRQFHTPVSPIESELRIVFNVVWR
jgi:hypothetical protein